MSDLDHDKKSMQGKRLQNHAAALSTLAPNAGLGDQYRIDRSALLKATDRSVSTYSGYSHVFDEIAKRLFERLDLLNLKPERILDLGTGNGRHLSTLRRRYPKAEIVGADISCMALQGGARSGWRDRLQRFWKPPTSLLCMDMGEYWPLADKSFDLVISNMVLPWVNETDQFASELERVLADGGAFFLSSAGPDTLSELRHAWASVDDSVHVNAFLDMHDVGDMFARAGLADPVMDTERIEVHYKDVESLLKELRATGCVCVLQGRRRGLMAGHIGKRVAANYPQSQSLNVDLADDSSSICASLELVVAHGWKQSSQKAAAGSIDEHRNREHIVHFQPGSWQSRTSRKDGNQT